ncbi:pyridoxal-dependent decarboxylase domain-containing protein [Paenibacillus curdlanolyticus YK9]|uniref:Pyridoxal-dependent decarboxylase domain-containing protein n=1 Tax=Paenibacillus curdlanolyticus YK9 TaxID=717606 RepID=E0I8C6_9BACL|nr:pyridoxal-dependent decarboxylase [Paenibacillus curdlanolyticus]EFM11431.1 pyridoxal-dependent decarboxylase domain-containing protein [Paenibacillus curdlanolyticus YK9]
MVDRFEGLYPLDYKNNEFARKISFAFETLTQNMNENNTPRFKKVKSYEDLQTKYNDLSYDGRSTDDVIKDIMDDFFQGTPRWVSPLWAYNVGTSPNLAALVMYTMALEENIYLINDGLSGNCSHIESILSTIFRKITGCDDMRSVFTFGGTGTNMYGMKLGLSKANKDAVLKGLSGNVKVMITKDAHYAQVTCADWLGVGVQNIVTIDSKGLYSRIDDAETKMRKIIESGDKIGVIIINGGTTYDHAIDDIQQFRLLIDRLVEEYSLDYSPHLHVDSVIGWSWLFFKYYEFNENPLDIPMKYLVKMKKQFERISNIKYADSWGVDFHKGIGSCPVASSMFCVNNKSDIRYLSKKLYDGHDVHQLSPEFSSINPSEFTLETSRSAGAPLAALASLNALGSSGYIKLLSNLLINSFELRDRLESNPRIRVCNNESLGFCTMIRVYPSKEHKLRAIKVEQNPQEEDFAFICEMNKYNKEFFKWDHMTRMGKNNEFEYSFTSSYKVYDNKIKLEALKFYNVSPHFKYEHVDDIVNKLSQQLLIFEEVSELAI